MDSRLPTPANVLEFKRAPSTQDLPELHPVLEEVDQIVQMFEQVPFLNEDIWVPSHKAWEKRLLAAWEAGELSRHELLWAVDQILAVVHEAMSRNDDLAARNERFEERLKRNQQGLFQGS